MSANPLIAVFSVLLGHTGPYSSFLEEELAEAPVRASPRGMLYVLLLWAVLIGLNVWCYWRVFALRRRPGGTESSH